jgi:hypothetical protein
VGPRPDSREPAAPIRVITAAGAVLLPFVARLLHDQFRERVDTADVTAPYLALSALCVAAVALRPRRNELTAGPALLSAGSAALGILAAGTIMVGIVGAALPRFVVLSTSALLFVWVIGCTAVEALLPKIEAEPAAASDGVAQLTLRSWWPFARLAAFTALSLHLAFPHVSKLRSHVVGNPGDAYLVVALLRWGGHHVPDLYRGFWEGPMFATERHVMAYSETFLPLSPFAYVIDQTTGSPVIAMNVLLIASFVACAECTYLLLVRITASRPAAFVGSLAFTFSTVRMAQIDHFQLMFVALVPLAVLLLVRLIERPRVWIGILLGVTLAGQFLVSAYFGVVLVPVSIAGGALFVVLDRQSPLLRMRLAALGATVGTTLVLLLPIAYQYRRAEEETGGRDWYPWFLVFKPRDLLAVYPGTDHLSGVHIMQAGPTTAQSGNYAYVGWFVLLLVPVLVALYASSAVVRARVARSRRELTVLGLLALFGLGIAYGRQRLFGVEVPVYAVARAIVPGVRSMLAIGRLTAFLQLALVALATLGFATLLRATGRRVFRVAVAGVAAALVVYESAIHVPMTRVPTATSDSVYGVLRHLDDDGIVAELPIVPPSEPLIHAFSEPTRLLLGSGDRHRSINGYSGATPLTYGATVERLNEFPSVVSIEALRAADVRYVVLHTAPIDTGDPGLNQTLNATPWLYYSADQIAEILDGVPPGLVAAMYNAADGIVLELSRA